MISKQEQDLPSWVRDKLAESEKYKSKGNNKKALEIAKSILSKDPGCIPAAEEVVDNLLSLEDFNEAKKVSNFIIKKNTHSYIAYYSLGFILLTNQKNKEALDYLKKANMYCPNNPEILRCLGWSLFHNNEKLKGLVTLERALNLRNDDVLILCDLGVCLLNEHIFNKSITLFEQALSLEPNNARAKECLKSAKKLKKTIEEMGTDKVDKKL